MTKLEEIPVFEPYTGIHTVKAVVDALDIGWLGMGAFVKQFEEELAKFLNLQGRHIVCTNTGTSAIHMALALAGVGPGDEVITTSFNYVADHQAISALGAETVFCDVLDDNMSIDAAKAAELVSPRTKVILPLHYSGIPCDIKGVYELANRHGLRVVEDATHALGSTYEGKKIGSFGDLACLSFDPVKVMTSIDGGAVICNNEDEVARLQHFRLLGVDKDTIERYKNQRAWEYDVVSQGYRYHMTNINAAIGLSQLARIEGLIRTRQEVERAYNAAFADLPGIRTPNTDFRNVSSFCYWIRVRPEWRLDMIQFLRERGVATGIHFMPAHRYSFYKDCRKGNLDVTERVVEEQLTLPLHSYMPPEKVQRVIDGVRDFVALRA